MVLPVNGTGRTDAPNGVDAATHAQQQVERFLGLPHSTTRGAEIRALQRSLNLMGASLTLDGVYGRNTEGAVRDFLARDMPALQRGAGQRSGSEREAVRRLQQALNVVTGSQLVVDGRFGAKTEEALIAWQRSHGVNNPSPEGQINRATWNALLASMVDKLKGAESITAPPPSHTSSRPPTDGLTPPTASGVRTPGSGDRTPAPTGSGSSGVSSRDWPPNLSAYSNTGVNTRLPDDDPNLSRYKPYAYGTERTIALIRAVAARYHDLTGMVLRVGDISQQGGGPIPGHASHRSGRNVDLDLAFSDGRTTAEPNRESRNASWRSDAYDRDATRTIIRLIKECNPNAQILFSDPVLVREGLVTPYAGHDNHMHVQGLG